jgi:hypothetical protein
VYITVPLVKVFLPFYLTVAVVGDYLALLETRFLLRIAVWRASTIYILAVLLGDVVVTGFTGVLISTVNFAMTEIEPLLTYRRYLWQPRLAEIYDMVRYPFIEYVQQGLSPHSILERFSSRDHQLLVWFYPVFLTSAWLWLYAGAGFLLKGPRHFDKSLSWLNRRFDIEKKPLSSIGLVAGALVALIYSAAVIVSRVV